MSDRKAGLIGRFRAPDPTLARLVQESADRVLGSWLTWVMAILLALPVIRAIGRYFYRPAAYSDFIVGHLAWYFDGKISDYVLLLAFVAIFALCVLIQMSLAGLLQSRIGDRGFEEFQNVAAYCSVPAFLWLADALVIRNDLSLWMLQTSSAMVFSALLVAAAAGARDITFWSPAKEQFGTVLRSAVILTWMAVFSVIGLAIAGIKLAQFLHLDLKPPAISLSGLPAIGAMAALLAAMLLIARARDIPSLLRNLDRLQLASQIGIPLLFLAIIPDQWTDVTSGLRTPAISTLGWAVPIALAFAGYVILFRKFIGLQRRMPKAGALSLFALCAILVFLVLPQSDPPSVSSDDYHNGETLVPWWSVARFGMVPFSDLEPARGLINYAQGLSGALFLDGTAGALHAVDPYWIAAVTLAAFFGYAALVGAPIAFIALLLIPRANAFSEIDIYNTLCLILLCCGFLRWRAIHWLMAGYVVCLSAILFAPGQGGLLSLALSPLAVVALARAWNEEKRATLVKAAVALLVPSLLILPTPLGAMLIGAFRYALEQIAVNTPAHSIAWHHSLRYPGGWNNWLWEAFRASWILLPGTALVVAIRAAIGGDAWPAERRRRVLAFSIPIFILTTLFVLRAAGRIDPGGPTRLGLAGIWMWAMVAPLLLYAWHGRKPSGGVAVIVFIPAFLLAPLFARIPPEKTRFPALPDRAQIAFQNGSAIGIPNAGLAVADAAHLDRLRQIKQVLDQSLTPDQTYFDATNRGAHYFYLDRKPPIANIAVYNAVSSGQQRRAVERLKHLSPPLALVASQSFLHDGGPLGLRSHRIYRHLLLHYAPAIAHADPASVWMIANSRADLSNGPVFRATQSREETLALLDRAFRIDDLHSIPSSWGYSWTNLQSAMQPASRIVFSEPRLNSLVAKPDGSYEMSAPTASIDYAIDGLSGKEAGLLVFDFKCPEPTQPGGLAPVRIVWTAEDGASGENNNLRFSARTGRQIVPLDVLPRWLLAEKISGIRMEFLDGACRTFSISNIGLMQRTGIE